MVQKSSSVSTGAESDPSMGLPKTRSAPHDVPAHSTIPRHEPRLLSQQQAVASTQAPEEPAAHKPTVELPIPPQSAAHQPATLPGAATTATRYPAWTAEDLTAERARAPASVPPMVPSDSPGNRDDRPLRGKAVAVYHQPTLLDSPFAGAHRPHSIPIPKMPTLFPYRKEAASPTAPRLHSHTTHASHTIPESLRETTVSP